MGRGEVLDRRVGGVKVAREIEGESGTKRPRPTNQGARKTPKS